jgi:hypothetical protein
VMISSGLWPLQKRMFLLKSKKPMKDLRPVKCFY